MILLKCVYAMRDADREKLREKITAEVGQEVAILPGGVELAAAQKLLFLCDRKACAKCSYPQCKHTPDLEHARNFAPASFSKETDGVWVEQEWNTKCKEGVEAK